MKGLSGIMKIVRRALLIGNSNVTPKLPGVEADLRRYKSFLLSNNGGAWEDDEIQVSLNDSHSEIIRRKRLLNGSDYSFVLIAGHGRHEISSDKNQETCIWITEDQTVPVKEYFPMVNKSTIIVDVCRNVVKLNKSLVESALFKSFSRTDTAYLSRKQYRERYDDQINKCGEIRVIMFSCDVNQEAGDDGNGGIFSINMLNSVPKNNLGHVIDVVQSFNDAHKHTNADNFPQNPVISAGRGRDFFPFGLS